jgi:hypothetical protein
MRFRRVDDDDDDDDDDDKNGRFNSRYASCFCARLQLMVVSVTTSKCRQVQMLLGFDNGCSCRQSMRMFASTLIACSLLGKDCPSGQVVYKYGFPFKIAM